MYLGFSTPRFSASITQVALLQFSLLHHHSTSRHHNSLLITSLVPLPVNSIKPTLKKVSKYENKFAKLQKKAAEFNFRNQLKTVKKKEFELEDDKGAAEGEEQEAAA